MDDKAIDLNLLASLDVLIEEANVTRAAARLGLSQPALSAQLARLRDFFGDPLLVPSDTGRGMVPTVRALELRDPLHTALKDLETIVRRSSRFDPMSDARTFAIAASDYAAIVLGLGLVERLRAVAGPGIRIRFLSLHAVQLDNRSDLGDVDILIGPDGSVTGMMKARKLFDERFVVIQRKGHPRGTGALDLDGYCALEHVLVSPIDGSLHGFIDEQLEALGYRRTVVLSVHQFMLAPMMIERTDFVSTLPERLALRFADRVDLFELPFRASAFSLFAAWHLRSHADPAHVWLRGQLTAVAKGENDPDA